MFSKRSSSAFKKVHICPCVCCTTLQTTVSQSKCSISLIVKHIIWWKMKIRFNTSPYACNNNCKMKRYFSVEKRGERTRMWSCQNQEFLSFMNEKNQPKMMSAFASGLTDTIFVAKGFPPANLWTSKANVLLGVCKAGETFHGNLYERRRRKKNPEI